MLLQSKKEAPYDLKDLSKLLQMAESKIVSLCEGIETRGYVFKRGQKNEMIFNDQDLTVIMCFAF